MSKKKKEHLTHEDYAPHNNDVEPFDEPEDDPWPNTEKAKITRLSQQLEIAVKVLEEHGKLAQSGYKSREALAAIKKIGEEK